MGINITPYQILTANFYLSVFNLLNNHLPGVAQWKHGFPDVSESQVAGSNPAAGWNSNEPVNNMRVTILSALLFAIFLLFNDTSNAQVGDYNIKKVCMGQGKYAAVVEHHKQYYVIVSNQVLHRNSIITDVFGSMKIGGYSHIRLFQDNNQQQISVNILSRRKWKYSGLPGARSICRSVVNTSFHR